MSPKQITMLVYLTCCFAKALWYNKSNQEIDAALRELHNFHRMQ
jgi:hypothetical protein